MLLQNNLNNYLLSVAAFLLVSPVHDVLCFTLPHYQFQIHHLQEFEGIGITCIHPVPRTNKPGVVAEDETKEFYAGTKRGKIKHVVISPTYFDESKSSQLQVNDVDFNFNDCKIQLKPYPIYSMTVFPKLFSAEESEHNCLSYDLLTGGGDRYITIWGTEATEHHRNLNPIRQLGPHTGWVKDLASINSIRSESNDDCLLFSIGCNCIEVWDHSHLEYQHIHKLKIESSVEMGSTLSSDLLCLETYFCGEDGIIKSNQLADANAYLVAGGVDGRLHRWLLPSHSLDQRKSKKLFVTSGAIPVHTGRLNRILVLDKLGALLTVGSDGYVTCQTISSQPLEEWEATSINTNDGLSSDSPIKLTASCIVLEDYTRTIVFVGSSCGKLFLLQISRKGNGNLGLTLLTKSDVNSRHGQMDGIHSLCSFECNGSDGRFSTVVVGHSNGLAICKVHLES